MHSPRVRWYEVLGLRPGCSQQDIVDAYREHAVRSHPDKGGSIEAFRTVRHAYEMLTKPVARAEEEVKTKVVGAEAEAKTTVAGAEAEAKTKVAGAEAETRTTVVVTVSLHDVCRNKMVGVNSRRYASASSRTCGSCHGAGVLIGMRSTAGGAHRHTQVRCTICKGLGKTVAPSPCSAEHEVCAGDAVRAEGGRVVVPDLPPVLLRIEPDPSFWRVGRWHLATASDITLCEALTGFTRTLVHPDGKSVTVGSDGSRTVWNGQAFRVAGRGIHGRGDLYIVFRVKWPPRIDEHSMETLRACIPGGGVPSSVFHPDFLADTRSAGVYLPDD